MFTKPITSYLEGRTNHRDTLGPPGSVFLHEVVNLCDATHHCKRWFARKKDGAFTKDSQDSFDRLVTASFAMIMSHFETFQRRQFAVLIDSGFMMEMPTEAELAKRLQKVGCELNLERLLIGANENGEVGEIVADLLPGWHNPERVNTYFRTIFQDVNLFSSVLTVELELLWQLRHSIVHTGGVITKPDARKIPGLRAHAEHSVTFSEDFMPALGRRLHIMIEDSLGRLRTKVASVYMQLQHESDEDRDDVIFGTVGFSSPRKSWFRDG